MSALRVGQRVLIVGRDHPWRGQTGVITGPFGLVSGRPILDWVVELDLPGIGSQSAGCSSRDLQALDEDDAA